MGSDWNLVEGTLATRTWDRSWRCEEYTDYGSDFRIVLHMQQATSDSSGNLLGTKELPPIYRSLSQVASDPDVLAYLELKQRLVKRWLDEDVQARAALQAAADAEAAAIAAASADALINTGTAVDVPLTGDPTYDGVVVETGS